MSFLSVVAERYGNKNAVFADGRLPGGTEVRVFVDNEESLVVGTSTGKKERGLHVIRAQKNGRLWRLRVRSRNILVAW